MHHAARRLVSTGFGNKGDGPKLIRMLCPYAAFSPANDYQMGWSSPVQLTGRNFPLGATVTITTPAVTHSTKSGIRIVPDWYVPYLIFIQLLCSRHLIFHCGESGN